MFIKKLILDGFKSYGKRTEVDGFDKEFTAITGLNGTGKSNILDSICFVLGITNLGQVSIHSGLLVKVTNELCVFMRTLYWVIWPLLCNFDWDRFVQHHCKSWSSKMVKVVLQRHRLPLYSTIQIQIIVQLVMKIVKKSLFPGKFVLVAAARTNISSMVAQYSTKK